jgi:hypothetical protein
MNQDRHLSEIMRMAQDALVEAGAVTRCERHDGMFIHGDSAGAESVALNLASVWLERAIGSFMRADLEEAVRIVLASAGKDGCSECAKARVSSTPQRAFPPAPGG